jgi:hypothetical protein
MKRAQRTRQPPLQENIAAAGDRARALRSGDCGDQETEEAREIKAEQMVDRVTSSISFVGP